MSLMQVSNGNNDARRWYAASFWRVNQPDQLPFTPYSRNSLGIEQLFAALGQACEWQMPPVHAIHDIQIV